MSETKRLGKKSKVVSADNVGTDDPNKKKPDSGSGSTESGTIRLNSTPDASGKNTIGTADNQKSFKIIHAENIIGTEVVLNGKKYTIKGIISEQTGESDVYLVQDESQELVYKQYKKDITPNEKVLAAVKEIKHPNIISLIDYGVTESGFFELMEYSIAGVIDKYTPIKDVDLLKNVIQQCVEGLHYCHERSIIHRDIKPQNIFCEDLSLKRILLADFGISSMIDNDSGRIIAERNLTIAYAAPESMSVLDKVIVGKETDYFSLGLTIISLWLGTEPFGKNVSKIQVNHQIQTGNIEIPEDMPEDIAHAVRGLITHNYLDRWGYDEVSRWLNGERVQVAESEFIRNELPPFDFIVKDGKTIYANSKKEMAALLWEHKDQGIKILFRGMISRWLEQTERFTANCITDLLERYTKDKDTALLIALYILDPDFGFIDHNNKVLKLKGSSDDRLKQVCASIEENTASRKLTEVTSQKIFDRIKIWIEGIDHPLSDAVRAFDESDLSVYKLNATLLLLQMYNNGERDFSFTYQGIRYENLKDFQKAPASVKRQLVSDMHSDDSKFLVWLCVIGFLDIPKDVSGKETDTGELVGLLNEMPWIKDYDDKIAARLQSFNEDSLTDLMILSQSGDIEGIKKLIQNGSDVNQANYLGITAFILAAKRESLDIMDYLRLSGANINPVFKEGNNQTPLLHELCVTGKLKSIDYLLFQGINPNQIRQWDNYTPLYCAVRAGDLKVTELLLKAGADTSILLEETSVLHEAAKSGNLELFKKLFESNKDVNFSTKNGFSILMAASQHPESIEIVKYLLAYSKDPNNNSKRLDINQGVRNIVLKKYDPENLPRPPALAYAVWNYAEETVKVLLQEGANPNIVYNDWSLLMWISVGKHEKQIPILKLLLNAHAKRNFLNSKKENVLHVALFTYTDGTKPVPEVIEILVKAGCNPYKNFALNENKRRSNPFCMAAEYKEQNFIKYFIHKKLNPGRAVERPNGYNPFHRAIVSKNYIGLETLAKNKKGINSFIKDKENHLTPLMLAAEKNDKEAIKILLRYGADYTIVNNAGETAKKVADKNRSYDALSELNRIRSPQKQIFFIRILMNIAVALFCSSFFLWAVINDMLLSNLVYYVNYFKVLLFSGVLSLSLFMYANYARSKKLVPQKKKTRRLSYFYRFLLGPVMYTLLHRPESYIDKFYSTATLILFKDNSPVFLGFTKNELIGSGLLIILIVMLPVFRFLFRRFSK